MQITLNRIKTSNVKPYKDIYMTILVGLLW